MTEYREFLEGVSATHALNPEARRHLADILAEEAAGRTASFEAGASSADAVHSEAAKRLLAQPAAFAAEEPDGGEPAAPEPPEAPGAAALAAAATRLFAMEDAARADGGDAAAGGAPDPNGADPAHEAAGLGAEAARAPAAGRAGDGDQVLAGIRFELAGEGEALPGAAEGAPEGASEEPGPDGAADRGLDASRLDALLGGPRRAGAPQPAPAPDPEATALPDPDPDADPREAPDAAAAPEGAETGAEAVGSGREAAGPPPDRAGGPPEADGGAPPGPPPPLAPDPPADVGADADVEAGPAPGAGDGAALLEWEADAADLAPPAAAEAPAPPGAAPAADPGEAEASPDGPAGPEEADAEPRTSATEGHPMKTLLKWTLGSAVLAACAYGGYVLLGGFAGGGAPAGPDPLAAAAGSALDPLGDPAPPSGPLAPPGVEDGAAAPADPLAAGDGTGLAELLPPSAGPAEAVPAPPPGGGPEDGLAGRMEALAERMDGLDRELAERADALAGAIDGLVADMAGIRERQGLILQSIEGVVEAVDLARAELDPARAPRPGAPAQAGGASQPAAPRVPSFEPWAEYQLLGAAGRPEDGLFFLHVPSQRAFVHRPGDALFDGRQDVAVALVHPGGIVFEGGRYIGAAPVAGAAPSPGAPAASGRRLLAEWQYLGTAAGASGGGVLHIFQSPASEVVMLGEGEQLRGHGAVMGVGPDGRMLIGGEHYLPAPGGPR